MQNLFTDQSAKKRRTTEYIAAIFMLLWAVVILGNLFECADKKAEIQWRKIWKQRYQM
jgi:hypothetical protein